MRQSYYYSAIKKKKNYKKLRHQLNSISEEKKLMYINYIMFAYTGKLFFFQECTEKDRSR